MNEATQAGQYAAELFVSLFGTESPETFLHTAKQDVFRLRKPRLYRQWPEYERAFRQHVQKLWAQIELSRL